MRLRILGSGTSMGVPTLGCECDVCRSTDPRDKRLRCSALLYTDDAVILIDCGPDFRQQYLQVKPFVVPDAILITHEHSDHVGGLDDLRPSNVFGDVNVYAEDYTVCDLQTRLPYCFTKEKSEENITDPGAVENNGVPGFFHVRNGKNSESR